MNQKGINSIHSNPRGELVDFQECFYKYLSYWRWFLASIAIFWIAGYLYLKRQNDVYKFSSSILIVDNKKGGAMSAFNALDELGMMSGSSMVDNEVEVIHSRALVKEVVTRLEIHTTYFKREFLNKRVELYNSSPIYVRLEADALNKLTDDIELKIIPKQGKKLLIEGTYSNNKFSHIVKNLPKEIKLPMGLLLIELRDGQTLPDYPVEVIIQNPINVSTNVCDAVQTELGKKNDVIKMSFETSNIKKGQDILNTLVELYNKDALEQIARLALNTSNFIDERLKLLSNELSDVEHDVENYKKANKLTDITSEAQLYLQNNSLYEQKRAETETQLNLVKYVELFIQNPTNHTSMIPNLGLTDVGLVSLIGKYNDLILDRERILRSTSEESPLLKEITLQIHAARRAIEVSVENSRKGLVIAKTDLQKQNALMSSRIRDVPRQEREFVEIKRQQQIKEALYIFLLQKREEAALTMATVPKARVIDSAESAIQVAPKRNIIMLFFWVLGFLIPVVVIYFRDLLNTTFASRGELEKLTTVPILSELGHNISKAVVLNHTSQNDSNAELFRLLRTKLQLALFYPKEKVILVTSTIPGEGKTYVSINLSISLSLIEKKVLLIGLDLRNPQIASHLKLDNKKGITSYLSGAETDYTKLIISLTDYPYVDVLPAGKVPPNPSELIQRECLDALIEDAKKRYDYIILDTSPVGSVPDTLQLNRLSDINLYVCRANFLQKQNMTLINRIQKEESLTPLYLLTNDVNYESVHYYGYGYGGYGYGYGNKKDKTPAKKITWFSFKWN